MEKEKERYRGEWGDRQVSMCGKSKMEPEKRRGNREQGVQGTLSHTLIHTHGRCPACADRKKIQRNYPSAWAQRIQVKWPRGHSDRRLVTHRYTHTHTTSLCESTRRTRVAFRTALETGQLHTHSQQSAG